MTHLFNFVNLLVYVVERATQNFPSFKLDKMFPLISALAFHTFYHTPTRKSYILGNSAHKKGNKKSFCLH